MNCNIYIDHRQLKTTSVALANLYGCHHGDIVKGLIDLLSTGHLTEYDVMPINLTDTQGNEYSAYELSERAFLTVVPSTVAIDTMLKARRQALIFDLLKMRALLNAQIKTSHSVQSIH